MRPDVQRLAERLVGDFRAIVADRLQALVVFGAHAADDDAAPSNEPVRTLAIVDRLGFSDLEACARRTAGWTRSGLATPLMIASHEFARSLDAFPIEFGAIIARHVVVTGASPFEGLAVRVDDLRRACEVQARSHLLHLREGYLETDGDPAAIDELVTRSAPPLLTLLTNLARIDGVEATAPAGLASYAARVIGPVPALAEVLATVSTTAPRTDTARLYPAYLAEVERLTAYVDSWSAAS